MKTKKKGSGETKKALNEWEMWGLSLFGGGMTGVLKLIGTELEKKREKPYWVATVNPEFMVKAREDRNFLELLQKTDCNVPDGVGLICAKMVGAKGISPGRKWRAGVEAGLEILAGKHREELVPGADLMREMSGIAKERKLKVFLLGGWGDRARRTGEKLGLGDFEWSEGEPAEDNVTVITKINKYRPDILLVAYGMKKQEEWIGENRDRLKAGVVMGVGRSFDYFSGDLPRAPEKWRKMGLEWFYSLIREPRRWRRQLALPKFAWAVLTG